MNTSILAFMKSALSLLSTYRPY